MIFVVEHPLLVGTSSPGRARHIWRVVVGFLLAASPASAQQRFGPRQVDSLPSSAPSLVAHYGTDSLEFGELRMPSGTGPFPVAVVIHGGCWTVGFAILRNTAPLASALTDLGVATWIIEYRQVGNPGGGWPRTFLDVAAGIDLSRVTLVGHVVGAQLAVWGGWRTSHCCACWYTSPAPQRDARNGPRPEACA
jgi:acetyl esterase/lipase